MKSRSFSFKPVVRLITVLLVGLGTTSKAGSHQTYDIFDNDDETRRVATAKETLMALQVGRGCAGSLLAPTVGISAAHCARSAKYVKSGVALLKGLSFDGEIVRTLANGYVDKSASSANDYWIFQIKWHGDKNPKGILLTPYVQVNPKQLHVGTNRVADKMHTLGFPGDISQGRLIHSWGYAKTDASEDGIIHNNIGLINGNSGGAIWRSKDLLLVSLVSGGPHALGQPGWNDNKWEDPAHFNWGPAIWRVVAENVLLQRLFPKGGLNLFYKTLLEQKEKAEDKDWNLLDFQTL